MWACLSVSHQGLGPLVQHHLVEAAYGLWAHLPGGVPNTLGRPIQSSYPPGYQNEVVCLPATKGIIVRPCHTASYVQIRKYEYLRANTFVGT